MNTPMHTPTNTVALCVDDADEGDADRPQAGLGAARGLAASLSAAGVDAFLVPRTRWHLVDAADVFVGLVPDVDPSLAPSGAWTVAWVHDQAEQWAAGRDLVAWDQVLAGSDLALTRLRRVTPRADGVLRLGVDVATSHPTSAVPGPVVVERAAADVTCGLLPGRLLEAIVDGDLPVLRGSLGLSELGLEGVPAFRDDADLSVLLTDLEGDPDGAAARVGALQRVVREQHTWTHRAARFQELVGSARASRAGSPCRAALHFFPDFSVGNLFQSMLYADLPDVGGHASPVTDLLDHLDRRAERPADPGVLHLHWTSPILQWATSPQEAKQALERFRHALAAFQQRGGRLMWTVHNVLPHDEQHREEEIELGRLLAAQADLIHVLSDVTLSEVAGLYKLDPAKVVAIAHSSYLGQYPDWVTPEQARARLGILPAEKVLLALGGIRPYKGLDGLLDAFEEMVAVDPTLRLLVAGKPSFHPATAQLLERCESSPRVLGRFEHVPDDQLQVWMRAADLAVLPYRRILNSGAFLLAQTFGLPVVAPREGALRVEDGLPHVRLFDPAAPESLSRVLTAAVGDLVTDADGARRAPEWAAERIQRCTPEEMSSRFVAVAAPLLAGGPDRSGGAGEQP